MLCAGTRFSPTPICPWLERPIMATCLQVIAAQQQALSSQDPRATTTLFVWDGSHVQPVSAQAPAPGMPAVRALCQPEQLQHRCLPAHRAQASAGPLKPCKACVRPCQCCAGLLQPPGSSGSALLGADVPVYGSLVPVIFPGTDASATRHSAVLRLHGLLHCLPRFLVSKHCLLIIR